MTTRSTLEPATIRARVSPPAQDRRIERREPSSQLRPFRTPVRGHAFAAAPPGGGEPEQGVPARLRREPKNPADPLAVAVWVDGGHASPWRIGYLDRGVAARVAPRLDAGLHLAVRVDGWVAEPDGRWHRPIVFLTPHGPESTDGDVTADLASAGRQPEADEHLWGRPPGVSRRVVR